MNAPQTLGFDPFFRPANLPGSAFRVFRVFRGHSAVRDERRLAQISGKNSDFRSLVKPLQMLEADPVDRPFGARGST